jgi:hypothetical protein
VSVKEGESIGIVNSSVFHTNPALNFGFLGVSVTVCDEEEVLLRVFVMICDGSDVAKVSVTSVMKCC